VIDVPLEHVSRTVVAQLMGRLTRGGTSSFRPGESGKDVAFELCRRRGALIDSIDEVNSSGEPPIVSSGAKGDIVDLKLLLLAGADVASTSKDGMTALHVASYMGHVEFVEHLFAAGADVMTTVGGHGEDPDALWVRGSVARQSTSLHLAAEMGWDYRPTIQSSLLPRLSYLLVFSG
jgi:ankyrin repeat protein